MSPRASLLLLVPDTVHAQSCLARGYERSTTPCPEVLAAHEACCLEAVGLALWTVPAHVSLIMRRHGFQHHVDGHPYRLGAVQAMRAEDQSAESHVVSAARDQWLAALGRRSKHHSRGLRSDDPSLLPRSDPAVMPTIQSAIGQPGPVQGHWKLIAGQSDEHHGLYDLSHDPFERYNIALENPEMLSEMRCTLRSFPETRGGVGGAVQQEGPECHDVCQGESGVDCAPLLDPVLHYGGQFTSWRW